MTGLVSGKLYFSSDNVTGYKLQKGVGGKVMVAFSRLRTNSLGASISHALAAVSFGGSKHWGQQQTVEFDTADPDGMAALRTFVKVGTLPAQSGTWWRLLSTTRKNGSSTDRGAGAFGFDVGQKNTYSHARRKGHDGKEVEEKTGSECYGANSPLRLLGHSRACDSLTASKITTGDGRSSRKYTAKMHVDASDAKTSMGLLAKATGHYDAARVPSGAKSSGKWDVTYHFTPAQIRRFIDKVRSGDTGFGVSGAIAVTGSAGKALLAAVAKRGASQAVISTALARFVQATGSAGIEAIRSAIGARPVVDLSLQGDSHITADSGQEAVRKRIAAFTRALAAKGSDRSAVARQISDTIRSLKQRRAAIRDTSKYQDMPPGLRAAELRRALGQIRLLETLRKQALLAVAPTQSMPAPKEKGTSEDICEVTPSMARTLLGRGQARLAAALKGLRSGRTSARAARRRALIRRWFHAPDRDSVGERNLYSIADSVWTVGEGAYRKAQTAEAESERQQTELQLLLSEPERALPYVEKATAQAHRAQAQYSLAEVNLVASARLLSGIEKRHAGKRWTRQGLRVPARIGDLS